MSENSLGKILYWKKKAESLGVHVSKIQAYAKLIGVRGGSNPILMTKFPTRLEYGSIDAVKPENQTLVNMYKTMKIYVRSSPWVWVRAMGWPF